MEELLQHCSGCGVDHEPTLHGPYDLDANGERIFDMED